MPVVWYLYIFFICQLFVYLEAKMSTNWHFWRLLKMQTNSCIFVNKHHKNFLLGYFFIPYVYLNFDRKKNLEVYGMSRYLRHLQLTFGLQFTFSCNSLVHDLGLYVHTVVGYFQISQFFLSVLWPFYIIFLQFYPQVFICIFALFRCFRRITYLKGCRI